MSDQAQPAKMLSTHLVTCCRSFSSVLRSSPLLQLLLLLLEHNNKQ